MEKKILIDTNIILSNPDILETEPNKYMICLTTLRELDKLKRDPYIGRAAQIAIKSIKNNLDNINIDINEEVSVEGRLTNDEKIILSAKNNDASFLTEDIGAYVLAKKVFKIDTEEGDKKKNEINYKGYKEIIISDNKLWNVFYHNKNEVEKLLVNLEITLRYNEYLVIKADTKVIETVEDDDYLIIRKKMDGSHVYVPFGLYKTKINSLGIDFDPLDPYQWIVLDSIMNETPFSIIDGVLGSGKTLLALVGSLSQLGINNEKYRRFEGIDITRPPIPIDKEYKNGYLPGELDNKLAPWLLGFVSNLKYLYEKTEDDRKEEIGRKVFEDNFNALSLEHIQGASIHNRLLLVDEYQLLSKDMLKQILSRIATGSKVILIGDPEGQTYRLNRGNEGYRTLRDNLIDNKFISYIKLSKVYRSELAELVEEIFK